MVTPCWPQRCVQATHVDGGKYRKDEARIDGPTVRDGGKRQRRPAPGTNDLSANQPRGLLFAVTRAMPAVVGQIRIGLTGRLAPA